MSKNIERSIESLIGGSLIMLCTPVLLFLAWPMLIFDKLFPDECPPEALFCLWSDKALVATLLTEVLIYSLVTYLILKLDLVYLRRASYIGKV